MECVDALSSGNSQITRKMIKLHHCRKCRIFAMDRAQQSAGAARVSTPSHSPIARIVNQKLLHHLVLSKRHASSGIMVRAGAVTSATDCMRLTQPGLSHRHLASVTSSRAHFHSVPFEQTLRLI